MKKLFIISLCLLCGVFASAQKLEFAFVTAHNVNVRKEPSTTAQRLMSIYEALDNVFAWGSSAPKGMHPNAIKHFILTTDAAKQKPKIISGVAKFR